jgi:hypothetical protein
MGEYADDAIDAGFAEWGGIEGRDDEDDFDPIDGAYIRRGRRCKFCGERALSWTKHQGKWRLAKRGQLHTCAPRLALLAEGGGE